MLKSVAMFSLSSETSRIEAFFEKFDDAFSPQESRTLMRNYVRGLLSDAKRKNTWQIAVQVV